MKWKNTKSWHDTSRSWAARIFLKHIRNSKKLQQIPKAPSLSHKICCTIVRWPFRTPSVLKPGRNRRRLKDTPKACPSGHMLRSNELWSGWKNGFGFDLWLCTRLLLDLSACRICPAELRPLGRYFVSAKQPSVSNILDPHRPLGTFSLDTQAWLVLFLPRNKVESVIFAGEEHRRSLDLSLWNEASKRVRRDSASHCGSREKSVVLAIEVSQLCSQSAHTEQARESGARPPPAEAHGEAGFAVIGRICRSRQAGRQSSYQRFPRNCCNPVLNTPWTRIWNLHSKLLCKLLWKLTWNLLCKHLCKLVWKLNPKLLWNLLWNLLCKLLYKTSLRTSLKSSLKTSAKLH